MSPDILDQRNLKVYGCDPAEMMAFLKETMAYKDGGKDLVIVSMLSDIQEQIALGQKEEARMAINRVKYLIQKL